MIDQIFTKPEVAKFCMDKLSEFLGDGKIDAFFKYVDCCAGTGVFYDLMPKYERTGIEIDPDLCRPEWINKDFLNCKFIEKQYKDEKIIVVSNVPFGRNGSIAVQFINHAFTFADYVGFILPPCFAKQGDELPRIHNRLDGALLEEHRLPDDEYLLLNGKTIQVYGCVFQIFGKGNPIKIRARQIKNMIIKHIRSTPSIKLGLSYKDKCDFLLPLSVREGHKDKMRVYDRFEDIPYAHAIGVMANGKYTEKAKSIDWLKVCRVSTNKNHSLSTKLVYDALIGD